MARVGKYYNSVARIDQLTKISSLLSEGFERDVFSAAVKNLDDLNNPLRAGNFAFPVRELLNDHILVRLAPDDQVKACDWYVPEVDERGKEYRVSRNKRIKYSIQAGIPDAFLNDELGIDFVAQNKAVRDAIDLLNKHTHVGPDTFNLPPQQVEVFVDKTLEAFLGFFDASEACRTQTLNALADHIDDAVYAHAIEETLEELDLLATNHRVENVEIEKAQVVEIDAYSMKVLVSGTIRCQLLYGSAGDRRRGDGLELDDAFPFTCNLESEMSDLTSPRVLDGELQVDTSSFYE